MLWKRRRYTESSLFPGYKSEFSLNFVFHLWGMQRKLTYFGCSLWTRRHLSIISVMDSKCMLLLLPLLTVADICFVKVSFFPTSYGLGLRILHNIALHLNFSSYFYRIGIWDENYFLSWGGYYYYFTNDFIYFYFFLTSKIR